MNTGLFDLSGHGYFVWASYGMCLLAIVLELWLLRRKRQQSQQHATQLRHERPAAAVITRKSQT